MGQEWRGRREPCKINFRSPAADRTGCSTYPACMFSLTSAADPPGGELARVIFIAYDIILMALVVSLPFVVSSVQTVTHRSVVGFDSKRKRGKATNLVFALSAAPCAPPRMPPAIERFVTAA